MTREAKIEVRCTAEEKAAWTEKAGGQRARSEWARRLLNTAVQMGDSETVSVGSYTGSVKYATEDEKAKVVAGRVAEQDASLSGQPLTNAQRVRNDGKDAVKCSRWMHHRPGVYCASCGKVVTK